MSDQGDGPTGALAWFPRGRQDLPGWRFDVVTLLAIVGESSVAEHAQALTASSLCLLPRIIPAPQALLRHARPARLPEVTATMAGVSSGIVFVSVGYFANIMHPLDELKPLSFKVLKITHARRARKGWVVRASGWVAGIRKRMRDATAGLRGEPAEEINRGVGTRSTDEERGQAVQLAQSPDAEFGVSPTGKEPTAPGRTGQPDDDNATGEETPPPTPARRATMSERITDAVTYPSMANSEKRFTVPPALSSPLHLLSGFSFLLTLGIMAAAAVWRDGTAVLAVGLMSVAGTVVCCASWWRPMLMVRNTTNKVPRGDVTIRTRAGAIVLVRCTEEVARELYSATDECSYVVDARYHRALMGLGMVLLMVSVVLLGNCGWESQALIGGSYILLNGLYWVMGLLPREAFWDLGRYDVADVTPTDAARAHEATGDPLEGTPSFTRTLWYAVRETKHGAWAERSGALPATDAWKAWLREAVSEASKGNRTWGAVRRKNEIMDTLDRGSPGSPHYDVAEQHAPLHEVQHGHSPS